MIRGRFRHLTRDEETVLGRRIRQGDRHAMNELVERNIPFALQMARRAFGLLPPHLNDDLVQQAMLGLISAAEKFDPERGFKFVSFAHWWVRQRIGIFVRENRCLVNLSLYQMRKGHRAYERSLETPIRFGREKMKRRLEDTLVQTTFDRQDDDSVRSQEATRLRGLLADLPPMQRIVLEHRYGIDREELTLAEIGRAYGKCRERIRQIERMALFNMRRLSQGLPILDADRRVIVSRSRAFPVLAGSRGR